MDVITMVESKVFDFVDYENRLAFNQELMMLVAREFIKEATSLLEQLNRFADAQDWVNVAIVAHRLKGASSEVSSHEVTHGSAEVERLAKQRQVALIPQCLTNLSEQFERLKEALIHTLLC